jgi:hypothetical protein
MKEIPQHCIDIFKGKFNTYPSVIKVCRRINDDETLKLFSKSHLLWFENKFNVNGDIIPKDKLYEYDSSGILIYLKDDFDIFILTKVDKQNVVDYLLLQIKRLTTKKD